MAPFGCHRADLNAAGAYALGHYTHEKNPVTAALATLEAIANAKGIAEHAATLGAHALEHLQEMKGRHALVGDVRGRGLLLGVDLVHDRRTKAPANDLADRVLYRALARGLSFKATMGHVLTLTRPLVTARSQKDEALDVVDVCLAQEARAIP